MINLQGNIQNLSKENVGNEKLKKKINDTIDKLAFLSDGYYNNSYAAMHELEYAISMLIQEIEATLKEISSEEVKEMLSNEIEVLEEKKGVLDEIMEQFKGIYNNLLKFKEP